MLNSTFQHLNGIGPVKEARWWAAGVRTWEDLARQPRITAHTAAGPAESSSRLEAGDAGYFADALPSPERWRVYPDFAPGAVFLDIETTGLSPAGSHVTVAGVLTSAGYHAYVRGDDLDELPGALEGCKLVVTFNGAAFDLPFLRSEFGAGLLAGAAHVDLRHVMRRAGYSGGLKRIERMTGTGRPSVLANLGGADAVTLWRMAEDGEPGALPTLVRYNAEDVASLPRLAALAVRKLAAGTPLEAAPAPSFPEYDCSSLKFDRSLVDYLAQRRAYRLAE